MVKWIEKMWWESSLTRQSFSSDLELSGGKHDHGLLSQEKPEKSEIVRLSVALL